MWSYLTLQKRWRPKNPKKPWIFSRISAETLWVTVCWLKVGKILGQNATKSIGMKTIYIFFTNISLFFPWRLIKVMDGAGQGEPWWLCGCQEDFSTDFSMELVCPALGGLLFPTTFCGYLNILKYVLYESPAVVWLCTAGKAHFWWDALVKF